MANKFLHAAISTHIIEVDYEFFFFGFSLSQSGGCTAQHSQLRIRRICVAIPFKLLIKKTTCTNFEWIGMRSKAYHEFCLRRVYTAEIESNTSALIVCVVVW